MMRRIRELEMMAGMRKTRAERMADRQVTKFRRQKADQERTILLIDKIRERERGTGNAPPMPLDRRSVADFAGDSGKGVPPRGKP
jgi:hypothetical protein